PSSPYGPGWRIRRGDRSGGSPDHPIGVGGGRTVDPEGGARVRSPLARFSPRLADVRENRPWYDLHVGNQQGRRWLNITSTGREPLWSKDRKEEPGGPTPLIGVIVSTKSVHATTNEAEPLVRRIDKTPSHWSIKK